MALAYSTGDGGSRFTGGCAGSTTGGIKVLRIMLLAKLGLRQLFLLAHPRAISVVKLGKRPVSEDILFSVWGFYVLYVVTAIMLTVAMMAAGLIWSRHSAQWLQPSTSSVPVWERSQATSLRLVPW